MKSGPWHCKKWTIGQLSLEMVHWFNHPRGPLWGLMGIRPIPVEWKTWTEFDGTTVLIWRGLHSEEFPMQIASPNDSHR